MLESTSNNVELGTRERLLEAAGQVFAEHGFRKATVRDICGRAKANIAAVNYHFRDKDGLYGAVLRDAYAHAMQKYPPTMGVHPDSTAQERLEAFVRSFLWRIFDQGRPAWLGRLLAQEMIDPTPAIDAIVKEFIAPSFLLLRGIVGELIGVSGSDPQVEERVRFAARSVVSQCVFYHNCRAVIERLSPGERFEGESINRIAAHITAFCLAGLEAMKQRAPAAQGGNHVSGAEGGGA